MDSNNAAAAATATEAGRGQLLHVIKAAAECVVVASQLVLSCYGVREEEPRRRLRVQAFIALSYAAIVALTLFARRLDARVQRQPLHAGRERWLKLAARVLASIVLVLLIFRTDSLMTSILLVAFIY